MLIRGCALPGHLATPTHSEHSTTAARAAALSGLACSWTRLPAIQADFNQSTDPSCVITGRHAATHPPAHAHRGGINALMALCKSRNHQ